MLLSDDLHISKEFFLENIKMLYIIEIKLIVMFVNSCVSLKASHNQNSKIK